MEFSQTLGLVAGLGYTWAYILYNRSISKGTTVPNGATWAIWTAVSIIATGSYLSMTGDPWKVTIQAVNTVFCIATFIRAVQRGRLQALDDLEYLTLAIGGGAAIAWVIYKEAAYGNLLVQLAVAVGFVGTWRAVWQNPSGENLRPWWIWTASYSVAAVVVLLRWDDRSTWLTFAYPIDMLLLHASVPLVCYVRPRYFPTSGELRERLLAIRYALGQERMRRIPEIMALLRDEEAAIKKRLARMEGK